MPRGVRARLLACAAVLLPALVIIGGYVLVQRSQTGYLGLTPDSGRVLYARTAPFADCRDFTPPPGTKGLCESIPPDRRGSPNQYLTGAPDHASRVTEAGRAISPAWRVFGPPPAGNGELERFALQAILNQPGDYLSRVAGDFHYYWADHHAAFYAAAAVPNPGVTASLAGYYPSRGAGSGGLGFLRWYGHTVQLTGIAMILLLLFPWVGIWRARGPSRRAVLLLALCGWLMPLFSDAVGTVDPRYMLPSYGPLAAAGAIGLARRRSSVTPAAPEGEPAGSR